MPRLPNAHLALVERDKICEYLLNPTHRYGASKARFFAAFQLRADKGRRDGAVPYPLSLLARPEVRA